jgi:equilibrative nucleoside transporter 1/2/3
VTLLLAFYGERINFKVRFVGGFSFYIVYFVTAPIVIESMPAAASWPLLLVMTFMLGTANAVTEASLYGYANVFGSDAVQKGHAGQALSGLLISALRVLTKASFPNDASGTRGSAYLFFALACVPCLLLVLLFYTVPVLRNESRRRDSRVDWSKVRDAWRGVKQLTLTVAANYLLTLLIFPGLVVTQPSFSDALDPGWFAVLLILAYNVCDYAFREVALLPKLRMHAKRAIFVFVASRIVFLPLFIMGVHGLVHSPAYAILLTCLLGATNGWASVNAFMKAQEDVEKRLAEAAGYIMINGLIVGITAGVVLAIPLHYAILKDS